MFKILHTADWHLGQNFHSRTRIEEHQIALDWLLQLIEDAEIDALIIAGDIFDVGTPPNYARTMYFDFLTSVVKTRCKHIIIVGGNHDSPMMLNAPSALLSTLNIHVVGCAKADIEEEVLLLKNKKGSIECIVAAVPYLRDQDIRYSVAGQSSEERIASIRTGIAKHYKGVATVAERYKELGVPIIATGHLHATGAKLADKQTNIYVGNIENIEATQFPNIFDYVALGHIHKGQSIGGCEHVCYAGSLIPLSFKEAQHPKIVKQVTFDGADLIDISDIMVPTIRPLITIEGDLETVKQQLLIVENKTTFPAWLDVMIESDKVIPNLDAILRDTVRDKNFIFLKIRVAKKNIGLDKQTKILNLEDLTEEEVFKKKYLNGGNPPEDLEELLKTFKELKNWMQEHEEEF